MKESKNKQIFEDAWLGLGDLSTLSIPTNPMIHRTEEDIENPDLHLMRLVRNPKYIGATCKLLFGIELHPIQMAIIQEFWIRSFPMYIASRGWGKALAPDTPVLSDHGWKPIKDIEVGDKVYGSDGLLANVIGTTFRQKNLKFYKITLRDGRSIRCCEDHLWKVWDKNKNKNNKTNIYSTISTKKIFEHYYWDRIGEKTSGEEYRFALPINKPIQGWPTKQYIIHPYIVGVLLGDGCLTQKTITFSTKDQEIVDKVNSLLPEGYIVSKHWSSLCCFGIKRLDKTKPPFYKLCQQIGIWQTDSSTKFIPSDYQICDYEQRLDLLKGLMDTDGYSERSKKEYYTISDKLSNDFLNLARSLGLHCKHSIKESWIKDIQYANCHRIAIYTDKAIFTLPRKLKYLDHTISKQGQSKYEKVFIVNVEEDGHDDGYCISVDNNDHTYITKDYIVTHNSFLLALYCILRMTFYPGTKIVVVGAAFRQSKIIFEYMENIWRTSPILRSIFSGNDDGPRRDVDRCTIRLGDSWTVAIPMGDGCLTSDTMVTFSTGFDTLGCMFDLDYDKELDTVNSCEIWDNTKFEKSFHKRYNGLKDTIKIITKRGFSLEGTYNHEIKVFDGKDMIWKRLDNININDQILIDSTERWHLGTTKITTDEAYALGLMIGDGCWTNKYRLRYTSKDPELVSALEKGTGYKFYQCADKVHYNHDSITNVKEWMSKWQITYTCTKDKYLPKPILTSSQEIMSACLRGIFDTDGHIQGNRHKGGIGITISLTNTSKQLINQIHYILLHYGIVSTLKSRKRKDKWNIIYELLINGNNVKKFAEKINFGLERKKVALSQYISEKQRWTSQEKYYNGYLLDGVKSIDHNKNYTYDIEVENSHQYNANGICVHNSKIRGLRAHIIIADEFASISPDIYETVVSGFAAVSASPIQNVKEQAKKAAMAEVGLWNEELEALNTKMGNQAIISGTADYDFKHFASYWKRYKGIIESQGDKNKLEELFKGEIPDNFNWKDYSIIRIPYELIPKGFMDDKQVSRAKATIHTGIYNMEYAACFVSDSEGFFRRSLIEGCVTSDSKPIVINNKSISFEAITSGYPDRQYVYGIDPASEQDNFSIVILEIHPDHNRIVYCWTTNRNNFKERQKTGLVKEHDFYGFCARKIRNLMKTFPCARIGLDAQGGGVAIEEALHDPSKLEDGENLVWPIISPDKHKETDDQAGLHLIELVQFAKADWTAQANHGLRKDFEDKVLLFPKFDNLTLGLALEQEGKNILDTDLNPIYDSLSECILEIEELKNELTTIVMTQTSTGPNARDRWDTPEVKLQNGKKGRLRKDRYSSLLIANMIARQMMRTLRPIEYEIVGGRASEMTEHNGQLYKGPDWFTSGANDDIYTGIYRQ